MFEGIEKMSKNGP